jgi:hypothetical protein
VRTTEEVESMGAMLRGPGFGAIEEFLEESPTLEQSGRAGLRELERGEGRSGSSSSDRAVSRANRR